VHKNVTWGQTRKKKVHFLNLRGQREPIGGLAEVEVSKNSPKKVVSFANCLEGGGLLGGEQTVGVEPIRKKKTRPPSGEVG